MAVSDKERKAKSRANAKVEIFTVGTVTKAKRIVKQMLDSNDAQDRWKASTFVLEQVYGKAAAKPLDKPSNPKDDKLQKLISSVMVKQTVNETNAEDTKPN